MIFAHAGTLPRTFHFPLSQPLRQLRWREFVSTGHAPPAEIHPGGAGPAIDVEQPLLLPERSLVCLVADPAPAPPARSRIASGRS